MVQTVLFSLNIVYCDEMDVLAQRIKQRNQQIVVKTKLDTWVEGEENIEVVRTKTAAQIKQSSSFILVYCDEMDLLAKKREAKIKQISTKLEVCVEEISHAGGTENKPMCGLPPLPRKSSGIRRRRSPSMKEDKIQRKTLGEFKNKIPLAPPRNRGASPNPIKSAWNLPKNVDLINGKRL
jgi:hypothetical protein